MWRKLKYFYVGLIFTCFTASLLIAQEPLFKRPIVWFFASAAMGFSMLIALLLAKLSHFNSISEFKYFFIGIISTCLAGGLLIIADPLFKLARVWLFLGADAVLTILVAILLKIFLSPNNTRKEMKKCKK